MYTQCFDIRAREILVVLGMMFLMGCASHPVVVSHIPGGDAAANGSGMVYSLPKGHLQINASRKQVDDDDVAAAQKAAKDAAAAQEANKEALAKAKAESKKASELLASASANADTPASVKDTLTKESAVALAVANYLTEKSAAGAKVAEAAAERARQMAVNHGKWLETVEITQLPVVPDSSRRFIADLNHRLSRDDKLKVTVVNGMLSTGNVTSQDQTASILLNLVQAAAGFKTPGASTMAKAFPMIAKPECTQYSYSTVFDPTDPVDRNRALSEFQAETSSVLLSIDNASCKKPSNAKDGWACTGAADNGVTRYSTAPAGLVYRVPKAVRIAVKPNPDRQSTSCTAPVSAQASSQVFVVPDSTQEFLMGSAAGPFTKNTFDFAFKDGMPTELSMDKPSELLSISALPLDILKAIISVPASIIKLRVDHDSQATALVQGQTAALNAQVANVAAQQALENALANKAD